MGFFRIFLINFKAKSMKLTFFTLFLLIAGVFLTITAKKTHKLRQDYESEVQNGIYK